MSIKLKLSGDYFFPRITLHIKERSTAYAFEVCTMLFRQLQQTALRLEGSLLNLHIKGIALDNTLAISDIWEIIELAHRIFKLYPLLKWKITPEVQGIINKIADFHNAYENIYFIIDKIYSTQNITESVLGDFQWGYRERLEDGATLCFARGSYVRPDMVINPDLIQVSLTASFAIHRFDGHLGVFGVGFKYFVRDVLTSVNGKVTLVNAEIMIDDIIDIFNEVISQNEQAYTRLLKQQIKGDGEFDPVSPGAVPFVIMVS